MTIGRKSKISISLSSDVLARLDRRAKSEHSTRSAVLEAWLREGERLSAAKQLAAEVEAYYTGQGPEERDEDKSIARASSRAARRLALDEPPRKARDRK